jgi:starch-binding outer membrane protein, SusD/RagB family
MKTIKYIFIILSFGFLYSCELDEYNPGSPTAESIWSTQEGFQTLVNAAYANQRAYYGKEDGIVISEAGTDLWFRASKNTNYKEMFRYQDFTGSTANTNKNSWRDLWPAINYCNAGLTRINNVKYTFQHLKNRNEGELRFLRAFYYWHVVEIWGGVSLLTSETITPVLTAQRSSVEDFYKLIIDDLEKAITLLPAKPDNAGEYSRATRKSAMAMLARAFLCRAYYSMDKGNTSEANEYFTKAKNTAHAVIDSAGQWGVTLYQNYADLWDNRTGGNNKNCKEALYVISNSTNPNIDYDVNGNRLHLWFMAKYSDKIGLQPDLNYGYDNLRIFMPTQFAMDVFDETKDSRFDATFQSVWYCNLEEGFVWNRQAAIKYKKDLSIIGDTMKIGDTALYITKHSLSDEKARKYMVVDRDSLFRADTIYTVADLYMPLKKYYDPNRLSADAQPGYNDIIIIRLAEMYMIAAEAEFQLGETNAAALDINVLRTRAAIKTPVDMTAQMQITAADITLDFILDERAREFCGEHMRWFDLKRTRTLIQRIEKYNKDIQMPINLKEKGNRYFENALLRPIPQKDLDALLNGEEFGQNPGYY